MINLLLRELLYSVCHAFQQEYYWRKKFNTESLYQHWKEIQTKIPAWSSSSWLQKMKMPKCNFTCQLKIILCQSLKNFFWGQTNWVTSGRVFFPHLFSKWTAWITLGFHLPYKGATRHPCTHSFPFVPAGYDSQMKTVILSIPRNSPFPSLTPLPARALN